MATSSRRDRWKREHPAAHAAWKRRSAPAKRRAGTSRCKVVRRGHLATTCETGLCRTRRLTRLQNCRRGKVLLADAYRIAPRARPFSPTLTESLSRRRGRRGVLAFCRALHTREARRPHDPRFCKRPRATSMPQPQVRKRSGASLRADVIFVSASLLRQRAVPSFVSTSGRRVASAWSS